MRKHLYLITEHENEDRVGGVAIYDTRFSTPTKNEEGPITVLDEEIEGFREVGKKVGLGYHDFESEEEAEDNEVWKQVIDAKLAEIDARWLEKAGIELDPPEASA